MNRDWILQTSETRRAFANATWVPLRASQEQARDIIRDTEIGYVGEFFGCGSVAFPPCYQRCKTDPPQRLKIDPGVNLLL